MPTYSNELSEEKLERIRQLVRFVESLKTPLRTEEILRAIGLERREGLGALRMCDVEEICHATAGRASQLIWNPGPRPDALRPPPQLDRLRYEILRRVLMQSSAAFCATDHLMREADFVADTPPEPTAEEWARSGYPEPDDTNLRKMVLGALKVLWAQGKVEIGSYGEQAVTWKWIGDGGKGNPVFRRAPAPHVHPERYGMSSGSGIIDPDEQPERSDLD